jgi:phosphoglycerate kinase
LGPIAERLSTLLSARVDYVHDAPGDEALVRARALQGGQILLIENIRFWDGEEANDTAFAEAIGRLGDIYVNDAFGTAHRSHASTEGVAHVLPGVAGLLMEKEIHFLGGVLDNPRRPLAALFGGAKVSDKIKVLERLIDHADALFVGGGMAATFLKAQGLGIGTSLFDADLVEFCSEVLLRCDVAGTTLTLPSDVVISQTLEAGAATRKVAVDAVPPDWMILDIGPDSADLFSQQLGAMGTVVWNGPMGVFEVPPFHTGTKTVAQGLAAGSAVTVIGGGSTAEAVEALGLADEMTHVSTGGGASLEFLEGEVLPGLAALQNKS